MSEVRPIPSGLNHFIVRLPNPISGYNDEVRVENEVAAITLARDTLAPKLSHLVPRIFGWGSAKEGQGWILQEHMPGSPALQDWPAMTDYQKGFILGQMADVLACFQRYRLPATIRQYGGLAFGPSGELISAPLSIMKGGPYSTYEGLVRATIFSKLAKADTDLSVQGWRAGGIRDRLDQFLELGIPRILDGFTDLEKVLVHADFNKPTF